MPFYTLTAPIGPETPVLVEVPHAGWAIPEAVRDELVVSPDTVVRDSDIYVDKLYAATPEAGATLLASSVSRYVIDLNRAPDDVDPHTVPDHPRPRGSQPRGVVWRLTTDGRPALRRPLSYAQLERRLRDFHDPYHGALERELRRKRERFGHAVLLAAHSMPSASRGLGRSAPRADVVPGTRGRTTADERLIDCVDGYFQEIGLSVRHDDPYRGGWTTTHYGRPREGWHAVQIELNRALYVHEDTGRPKDEGFDLVQRWVTELVRRLGRVELA
ncbi:MAG: N-formylglutamate amidohydrolase [Sandaracinaceae bacterium]